MHSESVNPQYEQALSLAESGQHEQALQHMLGYLQSHPTDAQALNDTGTILYCLQRGTEAVQYLEKALNFASQDQREQISWNLCEVYIAESCPEKAMGLFEKMRIWDILNVDMVNRTADRFLKQNQVGRAIEALSLSMRLWSDQKVLESMIEVLRSKRGKIAIFSDRDRPLSRMLCDAMNQWIPTECYIGLSAEQVQQQMQSAGVSVFIGCGVSAIIGLKIQCPSKKILVLNEQDIYGPMIGLAAQSTIDAVIACARPEAVEDLTERTGRSDIIIAEPVPQVEMIQFNEKKPGLRVAAVGPWNLRQNPMYLLQCFQKLNYIHPDSRLFLAGEFEDSGLLRYMQHAAEAMDLENQVFFDGPVKNLQKWLKDKQIIVSTAVDSSAMDGVWMGMAAGLKPVVHRFAGAETMLDACFLFDISEEFCTLAESGELQSYAYRQIVQQRFERTSLALKLHAVICQFENTFHSNAASNSVPSIPSKAECDAPMPSVSMAESVPYQSLCQEIEPLTSEIGTIGSIN